MIAQTVKFSRGDLETIKIGPITQGGVLFDATGLTLTVFLIMKASANTADSAGVKYTGALTGSMPSGFFAEFTVQPADTAAADVKWFHAWFEPGPHTIAYGPLRIEAR